MELEGVRIDSDELNRYSQELGKQIDGLTAEIHDHAGQEFNIDSPKQLGPILFETLEIKARVKKRRPASTPPAKKSSKKSKGNTPLCRPSCATANSKSSSPPMSTPAKLVNGTSGRVHTTYQQTVAATGRLSSKTPTCRTSPSARRGRPSARRSSPGTTTTCSSPDYSQVELRIAAALSKDPGLVDAFVQGMTCTRLPPPRCFKVEPEAVDRGMRSKAKAVNFGILYGQGAFGLAKTSASPP